MRAKLNNTKRKIEPNNVKRKAKLSYVKRRGKENITKKRVVPKKKENNVIRKNKKRKNWGLNPFYSTFRFFIFLGLIEAPTNFFFPCNSL
jgi:hypothetical protein